MKLFAKIVIGITIASLTIIAIAAFIIGRVFTCFIAFIAIILAIIIFLSE